MIDDMKSRGPCEAMEAEFKRLQEENAPLGAMPRHSGFGSCLAPEASMRDLRKSGRRHHSQRQDCPVSEPSWARGCYHVRWEGKGRKSVYSPAAEVWRAPESLLDFRSLAFLLFLLKWGGTGLGQR